MLSVGAAGVTYPVSGLSITSIESTWIPSCERDLLSSFREAVASVAEPVRVVDVCEDESLKFALSSGVVETVGSATIADRLVLDVGGLPTRTGGPGHL